MNSIHRIFLFFVIILSATLVQAQQEVITIGNSTFVSNGSKIEIIHETKHNKDDSLAYQLINDWLWKNKNTNYFINIQAFEIEKRIILKGAEKNIQRALAVKYIHPYDLKIKLNNNIVEYTFSNLKSITDRSCTNYEFTYDLDLINQARKNELLIPRIDSRYEYIMSIVQQIEQQLLN